MGNGSCLYRRNRKPVAKDDRNAEKKSCVTRLEKTACGALGQVNENERVENVSDRQLALNPDR
jgi:regulator of sirC expression with transglutaminase-like and TPR domain